MLLKAWFSPLSSIHYGVSPLQEKCPKYYEIMLQFAMCSITPLERESLRRSGMIESWSLLTATLNVAEDRSKARIILLNPSITGIKLLENKAFFGPQNLNFCFWCVVSWWYMLYNGRFVMNFFFESTVSERIEQILGGNNPGLLRPNSA